MSKLSCDNCPDCLCAFANSFNDSQEMQARVIVALRSEVLTIQKRSEDQLAQWENANRQLVLENERLKKELEESRQCDQLQRRLVLVQTDKVIALRAALAKARGALEKIGANGMQAEVSIKRYKEIAREALAEIESVDKS